MVVDLSQFNVDLWIDFRLDDYSLDFVCKVCNKSEKLPDQGVDLDTLVQKAIQHVHQIQAPV